MNWKFHRHYIFLDLEATCALNSGISRREREIIEIGAVAVESAGLAVTGRFQEYIKPRIHPRLTAFCTELTGITQTQVDQADLFAPAFSRFAVWVNSFADAFLFSWGSFDKKQLLADCKRSHVDYTLPAEFMDFKKLFYKRVKLPERTGLQGTLKQMGLEFEGRPHSALSDAENTARLLHFVKDFPA